MNDTRPEARPEFIDKASSRVRVYTPSGVLEGNTHHPPGVRLSDMLRNQATNERYMLLTDIEIRHLDGSADRASFVLVNTQHASVIVPLEDEPPPPVA
jgi:hypothetical protein